MKKILAAAVVIVVLWAFNSAHGDLVLNGGFETGDSTDWTLIKATSGSDFRISTGVGSIGPQSGSYFAAFGAQGSSDDTILQTLSTTPNQSYTFSFWLAQSSAAGITIPNDFTAYWNGSPVLSLLNNTTTFGWTQYSFTEVATGSSTTISFAGREVPAYYGLDNVSVNPVPIPGAVWLFGPGLVGLAVVGRRFKK